MTNTTDPENTAGWYDTTTGRRRWWDGSGWGPYEDEKQPATREPIVAQRDAEPSNNPTPPQPTVIYVNVPPQQPAVQQPATGMRGDRSTNGMPVLYNRTQHGHSIIKWILITIVTCGAALPWLIYYHISSNHYWYA